MKNYADLDSVITLVREEAELPGEMPIELRQLALQDPELFARAVVRATKKSIEDRLRETFAGRDTFAWRSA